MSRLASFRGPSTPTSSPARQQQSPFNPPASPSRQTESTYHRKLRLLLVEIRSAANTWDELVLIDGLKAAKDLVDARTELDNTLKLCQDGRPQTRIVGPKLVVMNRHLANLDTVLSKLRKQFTKMNNAIEAMELLLIDAHKMKGWQWVSQEPMWLTWSLERFVTQIPKMIPAYHRSLCLHEQLVDKLRPHSTSFEESRDILHQWSQQQLLEEDSWDAAWEDVCEVEVEGWKRL